MNTFLLTRINKITNSKIWYYIENLLIIALLFICIKNLTDYDNLLYQTWKNGAAVKAILSFTLIIFIIRKVKLFNWQSLLATIILGIVAFERIHFWQDAEDILNVIKPQLFTEWLTLMILIDMIIYKNVNNLFESSNYLLIIYALMTFGMLYRRNGRMDPIVLVFPMILFAFIKMDEEKRDWFVRRFIDGWFIAYIYVVIRSFIENPYDGWQYYGYFTNIGPFGIFMTCCFVISIFSMHYSKIHYGRKSFPYFISIVWLISIIYMLYIINTRTLLVGVLFTLISIYLFVRKNTSKKAIIKRLIVVFTCFFLSIGLCIIFMKICANVTYEWIEKYYRSPISPIVHYAWKFKAMANVDSTQSFGQQLFYILDTLSSGRLRIIQAYSEYFNYDGNGALGLEIETFDNYWAYAAHNTYVQFLVEYGYISFVEIMLLVIISSVKITKSFLISKKAADLLPMLWFAAMFGVWIGESSTFFYPITFFALMFIVRLLVPQKSEKKPH